MPLINHTYRKGLYTMLATRFAVLLISLSIVHICAPWSCAEINSWVDENGVRHFSNTGGSEKGKKAVVTKEYQSNPAEQVDSVRKDTSELLKMYEKDRKEYNKKKAEEKIRSIDRQLKKKNDASKKAFKKKMEAWQKDREAEREGIRRSEKHQELQRQYEEHRRRYPNQW